MIESDYCTTCVLFKLITVSDYTGTRVLHVTATSQLVTWSSHHTVMSSHGQLGTGQLVTQQSHRNAVQFGLVIWI